MANNSRHFNRKLARQKGLLDEKAFYTLLAQKCGYIDEETAKRFYLGLVKAVTQQLRDNGVSRLPHMGDLALVWQKERSAMVGKDANGVPVRSIVPAKRTLKFIPQEVWRSYFVTLYKERA